MPGKELTVEQVLALLAETPPRLAALTVGLTSGQLHAALGQEEWSANDVLAHLRACADVWGDYIRAIVAEERPTLRAVSPRTWIKKTDYPALEFRSSLDAFTAQRANLLVFLRPLPSEDWSRTATLKGAGKAREQTAFSYAEALARHEQPHIKQIEEIVSTMRRGALS